MKTRIPAILILLGMLMGTWIPARAQGTYEGAISEQNALFQVGENEATVTFGELGFQETTLVSPFDSTRVLFSIPVNWQLVPGGEVQLDIEVTLTGSDVDLLVRDQNPYGGSLVVTFNNELVSTIPLTTLGSQTLQLTLPSTALNSVRQDGRHQLTISLSAEFSCVYNIRAMVIIRESSILRLPFEASAPELNLSRLPAPFHLRNALVPERTKVVIPDEPDVEELKAALNVMSGFGSFVGEEFDFGLVTEAELTETVLAEHNLIFVGRPGQFDRLADIDFPLAVEGNQFTSLPAESEADGVIEMAISPWNDSKAILLVSGTSTEAVIKAAQAVSSGEVLVYENPALAYVAEVRLLEDSLPVVEDFTLQSLGYETETISGLGLNSVQYLFNASKEQLNTKDGTIDLVYYHSGLLDYGLSSFTVELNDQIIASAAFSKESEQITTLQIKIPPGLLRFGENRLSVNARLFAITSCDTSGFASPWLTISNLTSLHIPVATEANSVSPRLLDLNFYPELFATQSDLGDVAFVLPREEPSTWKLAGQIAYQLGNEANPLISDLEAVYADDVPQPVLDENGLIVIGRASTVPFLSGINDQLPAPFDLETDTASESNMQVVYRIPSGMSVGYLELMSSPFNIERPLLVLAGNTDEGLSMAGNVLLVNELRGQLTGVFAVTNGSQIATGSSSSMFSVAGTLVPRDQAVVTTPLPAPGSSPGPASLAPPAWLMPVLIGSAVAIVLIMLLVLVSALSRRREATTPLFNRTNGAPHSHPQDGDHE